MNQPRWPIILLAILILGSMFADKIITFYLDLLWFGVYGFESVLWTVVGAQLGCGLAAGGLFFLVSFGILGFVYRKTRHIPILLGDEIRREVPLLELIASNLKGFLLLATLALALFTGLFVSQKWDVVLKFFNATPFGEADPIFARDYSFYLFILPFLNLLKTVLWEIVVVTGLGCGLIYFFKQSIYLTRQGFGMRPEARKAFSLIAGWIFLMLALEFYLDRYGLLTQGNGVVAGINFADDHGTLPVLNLLTVVAVAGSLVSFANIFLPGVRKIMLAAVGLGILYIGGNFYPSLLQKFVVVPNELEKEKKYIEHSIAGSRLGFGLAHVERNKLIGTGNLTAAGIRRNKLTIENIRLWDQAPLLDTLGQIQEIRTYYQFNSVDNDRYQIDGTYQQTLLSPRELLSPSLPNRTWINEHLTFTHGYGVSLSPVNRVTAEGLPVLYIKDIPPRSSVDLKVSRPEIYFGELTNDHVFVNTGTKEFNYPKGEKNVYKDYEGGGGVPVSSFIRKVLFAARMKTLKIIFSQDINKDSRVLMYRNIIERLKKVAPFLHPDRDPYLVISNDGRLFWIIDTYTTSDRFPYSQSLDGVGNYIRNSVKAVIDAYQGTIDLYVFDPDDPIIQNYRRIFPTLFKDRDAMPPDLKSHVRYPADLFSIQTFIYATYHMNTPQVFYNKEDQWAIPQVDDRAMKPYYTIMKLPNKAREEYILMLPFTPQGKSNLSAWMVARSDGEDYGKLVVYTFPKQKLVYGPNQIVARINQEAEISRQISLWDQRGSQVIQGTLLVIPIEESLIYVRPLYLKADSGKIPELKRVIVGYEDRIAMEQTLDQALEKIFPGLTPDAITGKERMTRPAPPESGAAIGRDRVVLRQSDYRKIREYFKRAVDAQKGLDSALAGYGKELQALGEALDAANPVPPETPKPPAAPAP